MIGEFQGPHRWLSNFWPVKIEYKHLVFGSVEHAYQAAKCAHPNDMISFVGISPGAAKRLGRIIARRADWDDVKLEIMRELVTQKFTTNLDLQRRLIATGKQNLVEGNAWGDEFWGVCRGRGQNHLGRILMTLRAQLQATEPG